MLDKDYYEEGFDPVKSIIFSLDSGNLPEQVRSRAALGCCCVLNCGVACVRAASGGAHEQADNGLQQSCAAV